MFQLRSRVCAALFVAAGVLGAAPARADVLTFSGPVCGGPCGNFSYIDANYGSTTGLDVSYNHDTSGASPGNRLQWWDNYSGLSGVAWGGMGSFTGRPAIILTPLAGYTVTLNSLDLGSFAGVDRRTQLSVYIGATEVFSTGAITVLGASPTHLLPAITTSQALMIAWGPDGYDVGIDNVNFTVNTVTSGVPEPSTWAMMLIGFAGLGLASRRRRRDAVA